MRFQWWSPVLLEWDSNLANSCGYREKANFLKCNFLQSFTFSVTFLPVASKKLVLEKKQKPV